MSGLPARRPPRREAGSLSGLASSGRARWPARNLTGGLGAAGDLDCLAAGLGGAGDLGSTRGPHPRPLGGDGAYRGRGHAIPASRAKCGERA